MVIARGRRGALWEIAIGGAWQPVRDERLHGVALANPKRNRRAMAMRSLSV